jgi:hypothetical protein
MRNCLTLIGLSMSLFCCSSESEHPSGAAGSPAASGASSTMTSSGGSASASAGTTNAVAGSTTAVGGSAGGSSSSAGSPADHGGTPSGGSGASGGSAGAPASGGSGGAPASGSCTRDALQAMVATYSAAQTAGDKSKMPLSSSVKLTENMKTTTKGIWETPLKIEFQRDFLDTTACQTFSEVIVPSGDTQYVLGIRLAVAGAEITEVESIVTMGTVSGSTITSKDWNFDAKAYMTCSKSEDWAVVPEASRSSREQLIAAGEAYFMDFSDKTTMVPWGMPCFRLEGGKGCTPAQDMASMTCNVGVPDGITFKNTHWVVDLELNTAIGLTLFAGADPDSHMFRLMDGKIRRVHTLTQGTGK